MKKVYMVHCLGGNSQEGWYPWLQKHLEKNEVQVYCIDMPQSDTSMIDTWVSSLDDIVNFIDEETYFIGHGMGCQTILRYLETKEVTNIGGILFVTPWLSLLPNRMDEVYQKQLEPWLQTPIHFEKVKQFTTNIRAIFSTDDSYVSIGQATEFQKNFSAICTFVERKGHICAEDGITEVPYVLMAAGKMLGFELLEIVDENGNPTGEILDKELAHDHNFLHQEVALFLINSNKEILMEKRSAKKRFHPNCWGLVAGHVDAFESLTTAMLRELKEEVGMDANEDELLLFDKIFHNKQKNACISYEYYMYCDKSIEEFQIQEEELSEVKWVPFLEFKEKCLNNEPTYTFSPTKENISKLEKLEHIIF